jgi:regulatory protein
MRTESTDEVRGAALKLLARREHSGQELRRKLRAKGYAPGQVDAVTDALACEGLLSDERFVESYVQGRVRRGWGPLRIRAELGERGVEGELLNAYVDVNDGRWAEAVRTVRARRFGTAEPRDFRNRARQMRFLQTRGFTTEQIKHAMASVDGEDDGQ